MAYHTTTSIGDLLQACYHLIEAEGRAAAASTATAYVTIAIGYPTSVSSKDLSISAINSIIRSVEATLQKSITTLYTDSSFLAHLNTTLQTSSNSYLSRVSRPHPITQFQIGDLFESITDVITSTSPHDIPSE